MEGSVSIIGTGNLAWHLAQALPAAGFQVIQVGSRSAGSANQFIADLELKADPLVPGDRVTADYVILAVRDAAIQAVVDSYSLSPSSLVIHTSGSTNIKVLSETGITRGGVLYPYQTFTRGRLLSLRKVPLFLETLQDSDKQAMELLAKSLSSKVQWLSSENRQRLHLAGIFTANFGNFMLFEASQILAEMGLEIEVLEALAQEVTKKALELGPERAQTGPALRGDLQVVSSHVDLLKNDRAKELYSLISKRIHEELGSNE